MTNNSEGIKPDNIITKGINKLKGNLWVQAEQLARGRGIEPELVDKFLNTQPTAWETFKSIAGPLIGPAMYPVGIAVGTIEAGTGSTTPVDGGNFMLQILPDGLNDALNYVHGTLRAASAMNPDLAAHIPELLMDVGVAASVFSIFSVVVRGYFGGNEIREARSSLRQLLETGHSETAKYIMPEQHTVLLAFNGDDVADDIASGSKDALLYQNIKPSDASMPWIMTDINMSVNALKQALKCGGADNAGEMMLFPTEKENAIFAQDGGLEHSMGEIQLFIAKLLETGSETHDMPKIIVVANQHVLEKSASTLMDTSSNEANTVELPDEHARKIADLKKSGVEFVDPSELVADSLLNKAQGKTLKMVATSTGSSRYKDMSLVYLTEGQSRHIDIPKSEGELEFVCDVSDGDVLSWAKDDKNSGEKRVYIVQSKDANTLITGEQYNIPKDRVIFVPKLVKEKLDVLRHPVPTNN